MANISGKVCREVQNTYVIIDKHQHMHLTFNIILV